VYVPTKKLNKLKLLQMAGILSRVPMAYKKIGVANRMKTLREKLSKVRNEIDSFNFRKGNSINNEAFIIVHLVKSIYGGI
jgi:hypothetical protein